MPNKNGLILITPTSVDKTGTGSTATISANGSVSFSSCETFSLNGVFSTDYDNYIVVASYDGSDSVVANYWRLRVSGTDDTDTNYNWQRYEVDNTSISALRFTSQSAFRFGEAGEQPNGQIVYVYGPYLTQPTAVREVEISTYNNGTYNFEYCGTNSESTSYTGFTFTSLGSGSVTGRIAVYGLRK
jgi:hypothetical protein